MNELEDSPDLTDEQVREAVPVTSVAALLAHLMGKTCACGGKYMPVRHSFRRRAPCTYWRVTVRCGSEHQEVVTYRIEW